MIAYYSTILILSILVTIIYFFVWHNHFNTLITIYFILVPVANLGFFLLAIAESIDTAVIGNVLTYIGGCYLILIIMLSVFYFCGVKVSRIIRVILMVISTVFFASALSVLSKGKIGIFYKKFDFEIIDGGGVLTNKEYGFMHTLFYVMVITYFVITFVAIVYSFFKKTQTSRKTIYLLFFTETLGVISFFGGRLITGNNSPLQFIGATYVVAAIVFLIIIHRLCLYDVDEMANETMVKRGDIGIISFDNKLNFLGSNDNAKKVLPEISNLVVDKKIGLDSLNDTVFLWIKSFVNNNDENKFYYEKDNKTYLINAAYLYDGTKKRGYQLIISDDTKNQEYIKLLNSFNSELQLEVDEKTRRIVEMNDEFILGMATMVESRDNSTGGHIKRTSEGVRILINEILKDNSLNITPEFAKNIIKAAPMHDLGKIAVDDAILRKPGKFTPEEYEVMKKHSAEGARIIHEIVDEKYDPYFKEIAENVAHYHHERVDGSGYPNKLKGDEIPLEARIMAIADVYDALVSKRVYKEKFSFDKAYDIIMEGMGTQFDKRLEKYFVKSREKLEEYYSNVD
ncbi:MAG: HD domain-containing protein [Acholeplasmatales bacterium]|nr:HD domain-containing protein [Acholeplasmatales bacterium]